MKWITFFWILAAGVQAAEWTLVSPREEAKPEAVIHTKGGHDGKGSLVLETGEGEHWIGCWTKTLPVEGGRHYQFSAWKKTSAMPLPRRSVYARVLWEDDKGNPVKWEEPAKQGYAKGTVPRAEPEYPHDPGGEPNQWSKVESTLRAPAEAKQAKIELYLQWASNARVEWSDVTLNAIAPPAPRKVRLATAHLLPREGKEPSDKPPQYAPLIAEAARQKADLIVLGETLTYYGTGKKMHECAEPVPGPSTEYFGKLAKEHQIHIVAGLVEREGKTIYNTAALIGTDGLMIGKYRKVTLPRGGETNRPVWRRFVAHAPHALRRSRLAVSRLFRPRAAGLHRDSERASCRACRSVTPAVRSLSRNTAGLVHRPCILAAARLHGVCKTRARLQMHVMVREARAVLPFTALLVAHLADVRAFVVRETDFMVCQ